MKAGGAAQFGYYTTARKYLLENILEEIKGEQPDLTDHGPKHIKNVLENVFKLIGNSFTKPNDRPLKGVELYLLGLSVLFHDVGNIFNRADHQKKITRIYDLARPALNGHQDHEEKRVVLNICQAHCGEAVDGSKNTLNFVEERTAVGNDPVRSRWLAAILRFADELAEGEQRTSHYLLKDNKYCSKSLTFQQYANCVNLAIDRPAGRIVLSFHIELKFAAEQEEGKEDASVISVENLKDFLAFIYGRIEKLNQERQYAKHYCPILGPFKETSVSMNFWYKKNQIPISLNTIELSDLVVPGDRGRTVVDYDSHFEAAALTKTLTEAMNGMYAKPKGDLL